MDYFIADALEELLRKERVCRNGRAPLDFRQKTILLVDNGIHTGSTVHAAIRALRELGPARVILAIPVAAPESRALIESLADELVCLAWPEPFGHVGMFYRDFTRPDEEQIRTMIRESEE